MSQLEMRFTYVENPWAIAFLFLLSCGLVVAVYLPCYRSGFAWKSLVLATLRFLAVALGLLLLLRPILRFDVLKRREERFVVLLDTSGSMGIADSIDGERRLTSALRVVGSEAVTSSTSFSSPPRW